MPFQPPPADTAALAGLVPPQDRDAEMAVLGAMLLDNEVIAEVAEQLVPSDFYFPEHQRVYQAVLELFAAHRPADGITVKAELDKTGESPQTLEFLAGLMERVPAATNARQYAAVIKDRSILRAVIRACSDTIGEARREHVSSDELVARAEQRIFDVAQKRVGGNVRRVGEFLDDVFNYIHSLRDRSKRIQGLSTGLLDIDDAINGLQKSQLYIIAGRPSMGKTSLALRMIEHVALELQRSVLFFSIEMPSNLITRVMLCAHCHVNQMQLMKGMIEERDRAKLISAGGRFMEAPIFIDDSSDINIMELRSRARRIKAEKGIDLVVIDYLQQLHAVGAESRQIEIAHISQQLKALAKELEVPVLALSQLNRSPEGREDGVPRLSDLRESGSIEQDADVVMLLYRKEAYREDPDHQNVVDVSIAKNRTGPTGVVQLTFLKENMRFEPYSWTVAQRVIKT